MSYIALRYIVILIIYLFNFSNYFLIYIHPQKALKAMKNNSRMDLKLLFGILTLELGCFISLSPSNVDNPRTLNLIGRQLGQ